MSSLSHTIALLAYNNHDLTLKNVEHLITLGYRKNILLFDNGSDPSFETNAQQFAIRYQRETKNIFVNPAWNIIINQETCNYLTLLNNDCFILSPNYFQDVLNNMNQNNIGITSCKTKNIAKFPRSLKTDKFFFYNKEKSKLNFISKARRQGWLMTLDLYKFKQMDYYIPDYLKLWYGDDWIWSQFINKGTQYGVYNNRYAIHLKSSSVLSEKMQLIIESDNNNLEKFGQWQKKCSHLLHIRTRLFSRYV